jgi:hypothetical protein
VVLLDDSFEEGACSMKHFEDHDELTETEASGGVKEHGVRYVLGFSLLLAIVLLSIMWIIPAANSGR